MRGRLAAGAGEERRGEETHFVLDLAAHALQDALLGLRQGHAHRQRLPEPEPHLALLGAQIAIHVAAARARATARAVAVAIARLARSRLLHTRRGLRNYELCSVQSAQLLARARNRYKVLR